MNFCPYTHVFPTLISINLKVQLYVKNSLAHPPLPHHFTLLGERKCHFHHKRQRTYRAIAHHGKKTISKPYVMDFIFRETICRNSLSW